MPSRDKLVNPAVESFSGNESVYISYKSKMKELISDYSDNSSKKNAGKIARLFLDSPHLDLTFRGNLFLEFIICLEDSGDIEFAVKMTKHLINQGAYKLAEQTLKNQLEKYPDSKHAVNELKNIYFREAIHFWRTDSSLYGLDQGNGNIYTSTYRFINLLKSYRHVINFNDFSLINQFTSIFLILATNSGSTVTSYVENLLDFARSLYREGHCTSATLNVIYYDILVWFGHFSIANVFRQRAVRHFLDEPSYDKNSLDILLAYAECGLRMDEARYHEIIRSLTCSISKSKLKSFIKYYNLNTAPGYASDQDLHIDSSFKYYIKGKRVAIVGPYDDGKLSGNEINSYDVVIRLNNFLDIPEPERKYIGNRTDVGYFIHQMLINIPSPEALKHIKFIRLRNGFGKLANSIYKSLLESGRISQSSNVPRQFYKGASAVQTIIFDIIDCAPLEIKLFKMNFYLDKNLYSESYKNNTSIVRHPIKKCSDLESYRSVFFAHDFIPQFLFTKKLFELGYIKVDSEISRILSLTLPGYMKNMEASHKVLDRQFLSITKTILNESAQISNSPSTSLAQGQSKLLKQMKKHLRVFDFSSAYITLQELKSICQNTEIIESAQKLYDFNWLTVSSLFERNWNVKLDSPRTLAWSDLDKLYNIRLFDPREQLSWFLQCLDYEESSSRENAYNFIYEKIDIIKSSVGKVAKIDNSRVYNDVVLQFASIAETVKQAFDRYDLLQWLGDFTNAHIQRKFALNLLKTETNQLSGLAQIEMHDFSLKQTQISPTGNAEFDLLINGLFDQFYTASQSVRDENELLTKLISGKRVAIVGPAPTGELTGDEIDSYDVVIRFNYTGGSVADEFGTKTTISAYNKVNSVYFERFKIAVPFDDLDFYFVKEPVKNFLSHKRNSTKVGILPRIPFLLHKSPMASLDILYFILKFKPSSIKIFKHTLLLSAKTHSESYGFRQDFDSKSLNSLQKLRMTLSGHDLLSHHSLFRHFYSLGLFEADSAFIRVLNLKPAEFSNELQQIYGNK